MPDTIKVPITPSMLEKAKEEAQKRKDFKRQHTPERSRVRDIDPMDAEVAGILGEIVFGTLINQEPNYELYKRKGDLDYDFIHESKRIDVKTANHPNSSRLILFPDETMKELDLYVAVWLQKLDTPEAFGEVMGYATRLQMARVKDAKFMKRGYRKIKNFVDLRPIADILNKDSKVNNPA